jgi:hypothetical protein
MVGGFAALSVAVAGGLVMRSMRAPSPEGAAVPSAQAAQTSAAAAAGAPAARSAAAPSAVTAIGVNALDGAAFETKLADSTSSSGAAVGSSGAPARGLANTTKKSRPIVPSPADEEPIVRESAATPPPPPPPPNAEDLDPLAKLKPK